MKFTKILCVAALGLASMAPTFSSAQVTSWDLSSEYSSTSLPGKVSAFFAERVTQLTDGKLKIMVHHNAALGFKSPDHYTAVEDGALPLGETPFNRMNGIFPIFDLQSLPFLQSTIAEAKILDEMLRPVYNEQMEKNNQFILFTMPWTPQGFWAKKPIVTPADLAGMKVRVADLAAVQTMKASGAEAMQMNWGDTLMAISTGSVNALLTSDDTGLSGKLPEAGLNHFTAIGFTTGVQMTHVNRQMFDGLPKNIQAALLTAASETEQYGWKLSQDTVDANIVKMKEQGVTYIADVAPELRELLVKAAADPIAEWKKRYGPGADDLIGQYEKARQKN